MVDLERTLDQLNGYHGDIIQALMNAASHRDLPGTPSASGNLIEGEAVCKPQTECGYPTAYCKNVDKQAYIGGQEDEETELGKLTCGPLRIRNLDDLKKQLERHSVSIRVSPTGSDNDGHDHHCGIDSSVCSESSQG